MFNGGAGNKAFSYVPACVAAIPEAGVAVSNYDKHEQR